MHGRRIRLLTLHAIAPALLAGCHDAPTRVVELEPVRSTRVAVVAVPAPSEAEALAISARIQETDPTTGLKRHMPWGTIAAPLYASGNPDADGYLRTIAYHRAADAAIWTGHYLAAEAFRYRVTASDEARRNLQGALEGILTLAGVTRPQQPDLLARFYLPQQPSPSGIDSTIRRAEGRHGFYASTVDGQAVHWLGNTSRDQYSGVFFGLGVAYEMLDPTRAADAATRAQISDVATRLLKFLLRNNWDVVMPGGSISTTFRGRADQQLALAQVGRLVNRAQFDTTYRRLRGSLAGSVGTPISLECGDPHGSYYKFNLDHINLYSLIRLEEASSSYRTTYMNAFNKLRSSGCTGTHQNAHFNMVERALKGANGTRDAATRDYLGRWLLRRRRDYAVDLTDRYAACASNRACSPIAVDERPNTDFLWQRSPFLLQAGGDGTIETAAIDYALPYWMARYYGVAL